MGWGERMAVRRGMEVGEGKAGRGVGLRWEEVVVDGIVSGEGDGSLGVDGEGLGGWW